MSAVHPRPACPPADFRVRAPGSEIDGRTGRLRRALFSLGLGCLAWGADGVGAVFAQAPAAVVEALGNPFTAKGAYARNVWDMEVFDGRLFLGYGNSASVGPDRDAGPLPVVYFDAASDTFQTEAYTINEEQIERFRIIDGRLVVPGHDATDNPQTSGAIYRREAGGGWSRRKNLPGALHVYDVAPFGGALFAALGTSGGGAASIYRSTDDGATWQSAVTGIADIDLAARVYTLCEAGGNLFGFHGTFSSGGFNYRYDPAGNRFVTDTSLTTGRVFPGYTAPSSSARPRPVRCVAFGGRLAYLGGEAVNDHQWNPVGLWHTANFSSATRVPLPAGGVPWDLLVEGGELHVLLAEPDGAAWRISVRKSADLVNWTELLWFRAPAPARSFARYAGEWYFGLGSAESPVNAACGDIWRTVSQAVPEPAAGMDGLIWESFEHPTGTALAGLEGGAGWGGAWTATGSVSGSTPASTASYPGFPFFGGRAQIRGTFSRPFGQVLGARPGVVWFAWTLRSQNSSYTATVALLDGADNRLGVTHRPGQDVALAGSPAGVASGSTPRLVVGRLSFRASGVAAELWVDPDLEAEDPFAAPAAVTRAFPPFTVNALRITHSSTLSWYSEFDELRLGPTARSVVERAAPDPWSDWLALQSFTPGQVADGWDAPGFDASGDGHPNLLKFALGHASAFTAVPLESRPRAGLDEQGRLTLGFPRFSERVLYTVEGSPDLVTWEPVASDAGEPGAWVTVAAPEATRYFLRLRVSLRE